MLAPLCWLPCRQGLQFLRRWGYAWRFVGISLIIAGCWFTLDSSSCAHWRSGFGCCMWIPLIPGSGSERLRRVETVRGRFSWTLLENCTWTWPIQHVQGKPPSRSSSITHTNLWSTLNVESLSNHCVSLCLSPWIQGSACHGRSPLHRDSAWRRSSGKRRQQLRCVVWAAVSWKGERTPCSHCRP